ncbi:MAG TPA: response regulator [Dehalococcoidales bacterium]|nr:response regulator [Dehalococcoidales bacterium]
MLAKTKILTISTDPVLVGFLQQVLNNGEYEIISTRHTGLRLKDVIEAEDPEFIILDIMMPTLDGIGICLQLRQWTHLPIMMLSTWGTGDNTVRGLNLGCDSYLTEPFGVDTLKKRIVDTLKRNTASTVDPLSNMRTGKY